MHMAVKTRNRHTHTHARDNHSYDNNNKIHIDRILERRPTHRPGKCSSIANFTSIGSSKVDTSTIDPRSSTQRREKAETSHRQRHQISSTSTCAHVHMRDPKSIVETIIFCGRQGIPLRGHRDNNPNVQENVLANHGNFLALLHFRTHSGDDDTKNHLENAKGNARYTSHVVQNQLITICGDLILEKLLENICNGRFFFCNSR